MFDWQVAALPVSEFQELWREYVAAFGELIRQADHDARSAAAMHLVWLLCIQTLNTLSVVGSGRQSSAYYEAILGHAMSSAEDSLARVKRPVSCKTAEAGL